MSARGRVGWSSGTGLSRSSPRGIASTSEALAEADLLISAQRWNGALNRMYYALFYAARALLALKRIDSSRHSGVISLFQEHFVKPGTVPTDIARALPQAFARRQRADYGDFEEAKEADVRTLRADVERFLLNCTAIVHPK